MEFITPKGKAAFAKIQKPAKDWTDAQGITIPFNRISKVERLKEKLSGGIAKSAIKIHGMLKDLHTEIINASKAINEEIKKEGKSKVTKGNFTWYNFDKSLKIEVAVDDKVSFDEAMIATAREILDKFITKNVVGTDDIIRQLLNAGFHNSKGGLDKNKLMTTLSYRKKIKDQQFHAACDLIEESMSVTDTKRYYRIWIKDEQGEYQNVNLQFSNV